MRTFNMFQRGVDVNEGGIIRLEKWNKAIRQMAEILGEAKSMIWFIFNKKEWTGGISNTKSSQLKIWLLIEDGLI